MDFFEVFFVGFGVVLGLVLGSFAKALADRSLTKVSFITRSKCPKCKHLLSFFDLIPIISYLLLQGKCRYCRKSIAAEYLWVELLLGLLIGYLFFDSYPAFKPITDNFRMVLFFGELIFKIFAITVFVIVVITDLRKMIIPDRIVLPSIVIALVYSVLFTLYKVWLLYYTLTLTLLGRYLLPPHSSYFYDHVLLTIQPLLFSVGMGFLVGGFFLVLIIVTKGRGMGGGDFKLGIFIGLVLGYPMALLAILLSFLTGAIFGVGLLLLGKKKFGQTIPFGPFLSLGSIIAIFWGSELINWYLNLKFPAN